MPYRVDQHRLQGICAKERGATLVEAALSFTVVMMVIMGTFSYSFLMIKKVQWNDYVVNRFDFAAVRLKDAESVENYVKDGEKYWCDGDTAIPRCALIDVPDCDSNVPAGCIASVEVRRSDNGSYIKLNATVRVTSTGSSLFSEKGYVALGISHLRAGGV
jgi:hypothetical protein